MKNKQAYLLSLKTVNNMLKDTDRKDRNSNPLIEINVPEKKIGIAIACYNHNTIYDKGVNCDAEYRYYARGKPYEGFERGPITANGHDLKQIRREINRDTVKGYHK